MIVYISAISPDVCNLNNLQKEIKSEIKCNLNTKNKLKPYASFVKAVKYYIDSIKAYDYPFYYLFKVEVKFNKDDSVDIDTINIIGYIINIDFNPYKRLNKELKWEQLSL